MKRFSEFIKQLSLSQQLAAIIFFLISFFTAFFFIYLTGSDQYPRIKIGVGKKPHPDYDLAAWVLGHFSDEDMKNLSPVLDNSFEAVKEIVKGNIDRAMNLFN